MGPDVMILVFRMLSFKPTFSLSSFTFIKRLFSSSSLSAIRVVSSAYLRLLTFLLAILILACALSSPVFLVMYSAYKLNKQGENIHQSIIVWESESCSIFFDSLWPHGLYSPWNSSGQNTGVGSLSLLHGLFPTKELNPGLLHCRWILYQLSHKGSHHYHRPHLISIHAFLENSRVIKRECWTVVW